MKSHRNAKQAKIQRVLSFGQAPTSNVFKPQPDKDKDLWVENSPAVDPSNSMSVCSSYESELWKKAETQLRRMIDTRILLLIVLFHLLNYLDRNSITQARLYGLQEDTGVKGAEYQTAILIFSAGYILRQIPS
ncbi:hypothetical protein PENANT_c013G03661 [Penicillium antarcticum]|uniref:Major facilitator superfamily (MFS) profile domain-containing protein n=1 Tax=Penicillium antarcticum TaxID=416450 RepID=A0A1V6Q5I6_9EURO|nr:uncharacterized protein N7508_004188 [Penicillium antarcticum]KAJ5308809.1 hypothetical protein N7508_004188 [Penicillium antarcticum]OQD84247.1 hypothetical protein PENANT_c013G03661 [Penicillium antarcticum]